MTRARENADHYAGATSGIANTNHLVANANVADNDFLRVDGTSIEGRTAAETLSDIGGLGASNPTVTLGSNTTFNVDIQKNAWHYTDSGAVNHSAAVFPWDDLVFLGSNLSYSSGVITVTDAGLYFVSYAFHNNASSVGDAEWDIYVEGAKIDGTRIYLHCTTTSSGYNYAPIGTAAVVIPMDASDTVSVYGRGHINGPHSFFCGYRIGAKT